MVHGQKCRVLPDEPPHLAFAGSSCKDMTTASGTRSLSNLREGSGSGSSKETFDDLVLWLKRHIFKILIYENAKELSDETHDDFNYVSERFAEVEVICIGFIVNSSHYFVPQRRRRFYGVCGRPRDLGLSTGATRKLLQEIGDTFVSLRLQTCSKVADFQLANDDPYTVAMLEKVQKDPVEATDKSKALAVNHVMDTGARMTDCVAPKRTLRSPWFNPLPQRSKLVLGEKFQKNKSIKRVDVGQGMGRQPFSTSDTLPTLLPGSKVWCCDQKTEPERCLFGREMLASSLFPEKYRLFVAQGNMYMSILNPK